VQARTKSIMSKLGNQDREVQSAIKIGENNKKIIAATKAWCSHLIVEDKSAGLIHEMYGLPMNQNIHCPHATGGYGGMNFEWIAKDFIIENCKNCKYHKEVADRNFGRGVIAKHELYLTNLQVVETAKKAQKKKLYDEIQTADKLDYLKTSISHRSVFVIIYSVADSSLNQNEIAEKILEASKIAPSLFNSTAVDFLSLYFEDDFGDRLLKAVRNVASISNSVSDFTIERLRESIKNSKNIDDAAYLLSQIVTDDQVGNEIDLACKIIVDIQYVKPLGNAENYPTYPHTVDFIIRIYRQSKTIILDAIRAQLLIDDKLQRINICGLLRQISEKAPDIGLVFLNELMNSFEFQDDTYYDSADYNTCLTIVTLCRADADAVKNAVVNKLNVLSLGARLEVFHLIGMIVDEEDILIAYPEHCRELVAELFVKLYDKGCEKQTSQKILDTLSRISRESVLLIKFHFDSLIGYLVETQKQYNTFKWYLAELDKPDNEATTFNPYRGMNFLDVHSVEMGLARRIQDVEEILQTIIQEEENNLSDSILAVLLNLDSESDGHLKGRLIGLLRKSLTDRLKISQILPHLHGFLLDHKSIDVRDEALKFLNNLIDNHGQIVTQSLLDLIKIFIDDINNRIKARAVECFGSIAEAFPESLEQEDVGKYVKLLTNDYRIVHKAAVKQVYVLYPLLNSGQKQKVLGNLLALEDFYREENKDNEFCKDLIKLLLFITRENRKQYDFIVSKKLLKYTKSKEYYIILDTLERFTEIRRNHPHFSRTWLAEIIGFLKMTKPDPNSWNDSRTGFIEEIYSIGVEVIRLELDSINTFVKDRIQKEYFPDVFKMFNVLSYFNLHSSVQELSKCLESAVAKVKANEGILEINDLYLRACSLEVQVKDRLLTKEIIKSLQNS